MAYFDITKYDKNFASEKFNRDDIHFYDVRNDPIKLYGIMTEGPCFCRMPEAVATSVSKGVLVLHRNTAGGRARFRTNSSFVALTVKMNSYCVMSHMTPTGSAGFDLYVGTKFQGIFRALPQYQEEYAGIIHLDNPNGEMLDITINFPTYSNVESVAIGISDSATIEEPKPYSIETPFLYYGSSITQGGCCSRPGNQYQGYIERAFDANYINLGFSGNGKGEPEMADYIAEQEMSLLVLDYDHNAPTLEHLEATHEPFFLRIREKHPDLPVIMMSSPDLSHGIKQHKKRTAVIEKTYQNALKRGDKNVYFIHGDDLFTAVKDRDACTVDGCHPNDLGFYSIAQVLMKTVEKIFPRKDK